MTAMATRRFSPPLLAGLILAAGIVHAQTVPGEAVYQEQCATCHDTPAGRVPPKEDLRKLAVANILRELESGAMQVIGSRLTAAERSAVAAYLGAADNAATGGFCADRTVKASGTGWNGWSPEPTNTRFQSNALSVDQVGKLRLKWAWGFEGDQIVFSLPSVIGEEIFLGSNSGRVHALDAATGCAKWMFQASAGVRSAIVAVDAMLLFGDRAGVFYALDARTGQPLWTKKVDDHPGARMTGAAIVHEGIAYIPVASVEETLARSENYICCTLRGSIVALRIADGSQVWKTYVIEEEPKQSADGKSAGPSGAGIWATPTLDVKRGLLYAVTGNNYSQPTTRMSDAVVAMDLKTGRIVWAQQTIPGDQFNGRCQPRNECAGPDYDFGASAIIEGDLLLAGQKSGVVYALDPDRGGAIVWQTRVGKGGVNGGIQWGMASDGRNLYAATSDVVRRPGTTYDPAQGGGLTALRIRDGERVWRVDSPPCDAKPGCSPAQSAAVTATPGLVWAGSLDGHLRAYAAEDGRVLWDFDTAREFATVNRVKASGGGVDGPGPVVAGNRVFVGSGYARTGGMGGNVLLAFEPEN